MNHFKLPSRGAASGEAGAVATAPRALGPANLRWMAAALYSAGVLRRAVPHCHAQQCPLLSWHPGPPCRARVNLAQELGLPREQASGSFQVCAQGITAGAGRMGCCAKQISLGQGVPAQGPSFPLLECCPPAAAQQASADWEALLPGPARSLTVSSNTERSPTDWHQHPTQPPAPPVCCPTPARA